MYDERLKGLQRTASLLGKRSQRLSDLLDGRMFRHVSKKELLLSVASAIVQHHDDPIAAEKLVKQIVAPFAKLRRRSRRAPPARGPP